MAHIFFIDPLEKLNIKKDSTLMMALSFQQKGIESYILFEEDFYVNNELETKLKLYPFTGAFKDDGCYLAGFELKASAFKEIDSSDIVHMRIDPPYDVRYQRYLWMLDFLRTKTEAHILNDPIGIMKHNEKLLAYKDRQASHESYIGSSSEGFIEFIRMLKTRDYDSIILKPLDLYSGIGVEKVQLDEELCLAKFKQKVIDFHGAIVCQPFVKDVYEGEFRSIYFDGVELGCIIKKPKAGEFLANIAQGAQFESRELPDSLKKVCDQISTNLLADGVRLVAFDLLGGKVNEVNITCPGLLVEVSYALGRNLAFSIADTYLK